MAKLENLGVHLPDDGGNFYCPGDEYAAGLDASADPAGSGRSGRAGGDGGVRNFSADYNW
jgi:hypothetical protein